MNFLKLSGLAAIAGLLLIAAPTQRAEAAPVAAAGIASSVQRDVVPNVSEVQYRHHRHGYHHHHGYRHHPRAHRHWHRPHRHYGHHRHIRPHHRHWR
jgi:ribonuclease HII